MGRESEERREGGEVLPRYLLLIDHQGGVLRVTSNARTTHSEATTPSALLWDAGLLAAKGSASQLPVSHAVAAPSLPPSPERRTELEESTYLISGSTTKPQLSRQYGTGMSLISSEDRFICSSKIVF